MKDDDITVIINILSSLASSLKPHILLTLRTAQFEDSTKCLILSEFNDILREMDPSAAPICQYHCIIETIEACEPLTPSNLNINVFKTAIEKFILITSLATVCQLFVRCCVAMFELSNSNHASEFLENFAGIFAETDNILDSASLQYHPHLWYYYVASLHCDEDCFQQISDSLIEAGFQFSHPEQFELILSKLFTQCFLQNDDSSTQQKDRGQHFTPLNVVKFMWNRVLPLSNLTEMYPPPNFLDPACGIGSFIVEFLNRITQHAMKNPKTWRSSTSIQNILVSIPKLIWAIEVDRFTWLVCKMNVMIHLLPLYTRWTELQRNSSSKKYRAHKMKLERLRLFCNDTLKLSADLPWQDAWEREQIHLLRNPEKLKFDFVVTNPPYIIRKRGIVTEADPALYDLDVVSGKGVQAYSYFMWCGLNRLSERGQLCFVTASQWLNLEFAQGLRCWMWNNCHLEEFYQFEPYKMWKTIQTDALIFKCRRIPYSMDAESHSKQRTITFLRCVNRKSSLTDILNLYETFEKNKSYSTNLLRFKITRQNQSSPTNSWAFIMPSNSTIEEIEVLVQGLPGICDPSGSVKHWSRECPLIWHRGPNTNPVYALVVRTEFAIQHFGQEACERWGKPCFYWCNKGNNGKLKSKEVDFWQSRDIKRVAVKENSPAESYLPSTPIKYTLLMIDRADSMQIERENRIHPSSLYSYLQEAREMLQPKMSDRQLAYCGYKQCGATHKVKIITPINYGYFSVSQPRQRFFVDFDSVTVTNQCIYFTVKEATCLDPLYFLGFLNSSIFQLFMRERCRYDQQNRMRLFREKMAEIPYKAPSSAGAGFVVKVVESIIIIKKLLYRIDSFVPKECRILDCLRKGLICLDSTATSVIMDMLGMPVAKCVVEGINGCLYAVAVLLYCIDQYMYRLYGVNEELQLRLEKEMSLNMDQSVISRFPRVSLNDEIPYWGESALDTAGVAALNKDDLLNILDKRESKK